MIKRAILLGGAVLLAQTAVAFGEESWPTKPITLIVSSNPGGQGDIAARKLAEPLSEVLGQRVVVQNRPGGGGLVAGSAVVGAQPDGYTYLHTSEGVIAVQPALRKKMPYDATTDLVPVAATVEQIDVLAVNPKKIPAKTTEELVELLRQNPGKYRYGSSGIGVNQHLQMELLQLRTKTKMVHVPYPSGVDAATALLGGHIDLAMLGSTSLEPHILKGALVGLGVTSEKPLQSLPDLPSLSKTIDGYVFTTWSGVFAPAGTSPDIVKKLNAAIVATLHKPEVAKTYTIAGDSIVASSPEEFASMIKKDMEVWASIVKDAGITIE